MKKMLSALIAAAMVVSNGIPSFAKDTEELTRVLSGIKSRIPDTEEFKDFDANTYDEDGGKRYNFSWENSDGDNYKSLRVNVSPSGIITNYNYYDDSLYGEDRNTPSMNKLSYDQALEKAKKLIENLNPTIYPSLVVEKQSKTESLYDNEYSFSIIRTENGIPVYDNYGYVSVNKDASRIISFYIDYDENLNFTDISDAKDIDGAWTSFGENAGMELEYRTEYKDNKTTAVLIYSPKMNNDQFIDAFTGKLEKIEYRGYAFLKNAGDSSDSKSEAMTADAGGLTERELEEIDNVSGLISEEEAEKLVRDNTSLDFDEKLKLVGSNCYKNNYDEDEEYYYTLRFEYNADDDDYRYAMARINAKTGELISWHCSTDYDKDVKALTGDELTNTAEAILENIAPKHFGDGSAKDFKLNDEMNLSDNTVYYTRYVNDIKFPNDGISASINPTTKKLVRYSLNFTSIDFPSPNGIISAADAAAKLKEQASLNMYYIPSFSNPDNTEIKAPDTVRVGYRFENLYACRLDAYTGKLINDDNGSDNVPVYTDISGHYAEKAINELAKFGIGFESGEMKPDSIITQEEYAALLVSAFVNRSPIILRQNSDTVAQLYKRAVRNDIIRDGDGDSSAPLTREKAAVFMVRAMGGEKYAEIPGIFNPMFPDVTDNVGYISILAGLKVFNGDENGNFNPTKQLTRAEAMTVIYNYLSR